MSEVTREEDGEIELNLGLSLCDSFRKPAKSNPQEQRPKGSETPLLMFQNRVRNREEEGEIGERTSKRERIEDGIDPSMLTLSQNVGPYPGYNSPPAKIPVVPQPYSLEYPHAVPYSCVVPCWAPVSGNVRPEVCWSFQPYQGNALSGCNRVMKPDPESGGNQNVVSDGSPSRSSPASAEQGGSSSDTGSRSNHSKHEQSAHCETTKNPGHPERCVSPNHMDSKSPNSVEKVTIMPGIYQSNPNKLHKPTKPEIHSEPVKKPEIQEDTQQVPTSGPLRPASQDLGRPPKPDQVQRANNQSQKMPSFSQMPCVSTTGNGPNGKTITGFLYRYTKSEVSIICVCHGTSFSPSEFVEHAGGTDVSHPLKHITVIPSAFG